MNKPRLENFETKTNCPNCEKKFIINLHTKSCPYCGSEIRGRCCIQMEYSGFTNEGIGYAVDQIDVDWNEQAVPKAKDYLDYTSFSKSGLIGKLEYSGFTNEQAVYAVDQVGL